MLMLNRTAVSTTTQAGQPEQSAAFVPRAGGPPDTRGYMIAGYVVAFAIADNTIPRSLIWDTAEPYHYLRVARGAHGGEVLIVGGNDHRVGQGTPEVQWSELEKWTRQWIPQVGHIVARWSGQIIEPADHLAHIGHSPDMEHVYVVTGDSGNGLTHGTIAGLMIPEMLHGKHPRWERVYDPKRSHLHSAGTLLRK